MTQTEKPTLTIETVDQQQNNKEVIELTKKWSEYFQEKCASRFIAPVKGDWKINGRPLSESEGYSTGIQTLWLFENNIYPSVYKTISSTIKSNATRWYSLPFTHQILVIAPTDAKNTLKSSEVIQTTDSPQEEVYCINFQLHCLSNETPISRGPNTLAIRIFIPKTKALEFLSDIKQNPPLFMEVLKSMYEGIDNPEITYPVKTLTIFNQINDKVEKEDFDFDSNNNVVSK